MDDLPLEVAFPELNHVQLRLLKERIKRMVTIQLVKEMSMTVAGSDGHRVIGNLCAWLDEDPALNDLDKKIKKG